MSKDNFHILCLDDCFVERGGIQKFTPLNASVTPNRLTGFYMRATLGFNGLNSIPFLTTLVVLATFKQT